MILRGKTALVTGAARRLGRAISLALAAEGANVVIHYHRSQDDAQAAALEITRLGAKAWLLQADLADPDQASSLISRAGDLAGPIDGLVNSASIFPNDRLTDFTPEALHANVNVNALAPALVARAFAAQSVPGAIVNLLDARIVDYDREHVSYHLSKRMLFSLTRMMALEFAPTVRVNAVAPGLVLPPEGEDESYLERLASTTPLNRHGGPEDVADAVLFLLRSEFITGQVIYVDGGRNLRGSVYG